MSRWRAGAGAALAGVLATMLSACGGPGGLHEAEVACGHVDKGLALLRKAPGSSDPARLRSEALTQLRQGLQPATLAAARAAQWAPLATTLSETSRVSPARLAGALAQQCAAVRRGFVPPAPSSNTGQGTPPPGAPSTT